MSSIQYGDSTLGAPEPVPGAADLQQAPPLPPVPGLVPVTPPTEPVAPLVEPVAAPVAAPVVPVAPVAEPAPAVPVNDMRDVPLGTLVFRAGLLPEEKLEEALQEGMKTGKRLGEILLERGWVSENDLGRLLAAQKGLPFVELDPAAIDLTAPPLLHPEKARLHGALPIGFEGGVPVVAVADPSNDLVVENVRRALACEPVFVVAGRDALQRTIANVYGTAVETPQPEAEAPPPAPAPAEPLVPPAPEPVAAPVQPEPAPLQAEPVVQLPPEPQPVLPAEPVVAQPPANGDGMWLGRPEDVVQQPAVQQVQPVQPVQPVSPVQPVQPAAPETPVLPPLAPPVVEVALPQPEVVVPAPEPIAVAAVAPVEPVAPTPPPEPVAPAAPAAPEPQDDVSATWLVVLRMVDGERVEVGSFADQAQAVEGARGVVAQVVADGSWPFVSDRFIRPDAIVSVDLVEHEAGRWLGSSARAAWGGDQQPPSV